MFIVLFALAVAALCDTANCCHRLRLASGERTGPVLFVRNDSRTER